MQMFLVGIQAPSICGSSHIPKMSPNVFLGVISLPVSWEGPRAWRTTQRCLMGQSWKYYISLLTVCVCVCVCVCVRACAQLHPTPWTVACQAPLSMEFSRQSELSFLLQGIFPTQRTLVSCVSCIGRQILYH